MLVALRPAQDGARDRQGTSTLVPHSIDKAHSDTPIKSA